MVLEVHTSGVKGNADRLSAAAIEVEVSQLEPGHLILFLCHREFYF